MSAKIIYIHTYSCYDHYSGWPSTKNDDVDDDNDDDDDYYYYYYKILYLYSQ